MSLKAKTWTGLGAVLLAGTALTAPLAQAEPGRDLLPGLSQADSPLLLAQSSPGGGEGEGAGGAADLASDDVAYLTQFGLVRGHLRVGVELYRQSAVAAAKTHMKHPGDELYATLAPAIAARGLPDFADKLEALAQAVEGDRPAAEVEQAYAALQSAIADAEGGLAGGELKTVLKTIVRLVRTAAEEYEIGVKAGQVVNGHEYQDALGFTQVAGDLLAAIDAHRRKGAETALAEIERQLAALKPAWPSLVPPERVSADASQIFAAAARIEIAAISVI